MLFLYTKERTNPLLIWFLAFVILDCLSWLAFNFAWLNILLLSLLALASIIIFFKKKSWLIYLPLAELFWGGLGHSFSFGIFNTRLVIFVVLIILFLAQNISRLKQLKFFSDKYLAKLWLLTIFWLLIMVLVALLKKTPLSDIFFDANAYLYLLYWPLWREYYSKENLATIKNIFVAAIIITALKTILFFNLFVQNYLSVDLNSLYKWIRDLRSGEITAGGNNFWRVFMPAQIFLLAAVLLVPLYKKILSLKSILFLSFILSTIYLSLSRSFWLGLALAIIFSFILQIFAKNFDYLKKYLLALFLAGLLAIVLVELAYNLPKSNNWDIFSRRSLSTTEAAVASRWQLWPVMWQSIGQAPIWGQGFGWRLNYQSSDPRIKNLANPEGWTNTYAFEWGWLDQLLKGGVIFILLLIAWLAIILQKWQNSSFDKTSKIAAMGILVAFIVIHFFSPYLNHPLGLGTLLLANLLASDYGK